MIEHIPELINAGVDSLKIEGRAKSAYYTAVVTNAYRHAIDEALSGKKTVSPWILEELEKVSHREYSTGFFFGHEPGQVTDNGGYMTTTRHTLPSATAFSPETDWTFCLPAANHLKSW